MLGRGAATCGDSDSIASIAGALAGAAHGFGVWPAQWAGQIEYRTELDRIGQAWDQPGS
jgi:ADP-ribosylglycohydrolase